MTSDGESDGVVVRGVVPAELSRDAVGGDVLRQVGGLPAAAEELDLAGDDGIHEQPDHPPQALETKNGRKHVKSARYRPILSANRRRPRPAHAYACADPAPNGQNGGN